VNAAYDFAGDQRILAIMIFCAENPYFISEGRLAA
jgi:hypothetical protein